MQSWAIKTELARQVVQIAQDEEDAENFFLHVDDFLEVDFKIPSKTNASVFHTTLDERDPLLRFEMGYLLAQHLASHPETTNMGVSLPYKGSAEFCTGCLDLSDAYLMWHVADQAPYMFLERGGHEKIVAAVDLRPHPYPTETELQLISGMLHEAAVLRKNTIPPNAYVEINYPPFVAATFLEDRYGDVVAKFVTKDNRCLAIKMNLPTDMENLDNKPRIFEQIVGGWEPIDKEEMQRHDGTSWPARIFPIYAITAAIVRDFLVVEDRVSVLGPPRYSRPIKCHAYAEPLVVYLPRIRYNRERLNQDSVNDAMNYESRRAHFVRDHLRELPKRREASKVQLTKAKIAGVHVPEGYTWVRGHERGLGHDREVVYRSRSVSKLVFEVLPHKERKKFESMSWFEFEKFVASFVKTLGYEIVQKSSPRADGGIDVLGHRATKSGEETVIFQAKHWSKPVGADKVRECEGIKKLNNVNKVVLVTSGRFTTGAVAEAQKLGVDLVDGPKLATGH
jgi:hypothetical protein